MNVLKTVKLIFAALIIMICTVIPGEMYQLYLDSFIGPGECDITFKNYTGEPQALLKEIELYAHENNISMFKIDKVSTSKKNSQFRIYVTDKETEELLKNRYAIKTGTSKSFLCGSSVVSFHGFDEYNSKAVGFRCYFFGSQDDLLNFCHNPSGDVCDAVKSAYANVNGDRMHSYTLYIVMIWLIGILLICLMTAYENAAKKKENFIRMSLGENMKTKLLKSSLTDTVFITAAFIISLTAYVMNSGIAFLIKSVLLLFILLVALNFAIGFTALSDKISALSSKDKTSNKLLISNYITKAFCMIFAVLLLSFNVATIFEYFEFQKQKEFFEEYKDYSYCYVRNPQINERPVERFYNKYYSTLEPMLLTARQYDKQQVCLANRNAAPYLESKIEDFDKIDFSKKFYIFISGKKKISAKKLEALKSIPYDYKEKELEVVYYNNNIDIVANNNASDPKTDIYRNPIIILSTDSDYMFFDCISTIGSSLLKMTDEAQSYIDNHDLKIVHNINALDYFSERSLELMNSFYMAFFFCLIVLVLDILATAMVVKMEYSIRSKELAIKKVLGYSAFERFTPLFGCSSALWLVCTVIAVIISISCGYGKVTHILISSVFVLMFDLLTCRINTVIYDRQNVQKILKGGAL